jgi:benzoyl-CoA reductase/2-hydroxyglutaryl-CoA dehydratase subunit BcrC/BadD/HgdB
VSMKRIVYTSPFVPAEFISAHGMLPSRIVPMPGRRGKHGAREGMCPYALAFVNEVTGMRRIGAVVVTTTCDQMRRAADLIALRSNAPLFVMNVPATWRTAASRRLYRSELERLGRFLVGLGGKTPSTRELSRLMRSSAAEQKLCPPVDQTASGPSSLLEGRASALPFVKPVALIGGPLPADERWLIGAIENAGGRIVLDGTENGERTLPAQFSMKRIKTDPIAELVRAYFDTIPDIFRRPNSGLYEWLDRMVAQRGAEGIIVRHYVWCDMWRAEVQRIVERTNLPVLHIDTEGGNLSRERTVSRIQAFFEMLK